MASRICTLAVAGALLFGVGCHQAIDFEQRTLVAAECDAGELSCAGNSVRACEDGHWAAPVACEGAHPTCLDGVCGTSVECSATETKCDGTSLVACAGDLWQQPVACGGDSICRDGECIVPCSSEGDSSCDIDTPLVCVDGAWVAQAPCAGAAPVCSDGACLQELMPLPVSGGHSHMCVVGSSGSVHCWGRNATRQLGVPGLEAHPLPAKVEGLPEDIVELALGWNHSCARTSTGDVWCWGANSYGELGPDVPLSNAHVPSKVTGIPAAKAVRAADDRTCILSMDGDVWCFGHNNGGEFTLPVDDGIHDPARLRGLTGLSDLALGTSLTCGVRPDGTAACIGDWGPLAELPLNDVVALRLNDLHHCALRQGGKVSCWGIDQFGELGNGPPLELLTSPEELAFENVEDATTGWRHTCLLAAGHASCVGYALQGQLGNGVSPNFNLSFVPVQLSDTVSDLTSNFGVTCAKVGRRGLHCWGDNANGSVGDGTFENRAAPVAIDWDAP